MKKGKYILLVLILGLVACKPDDDCEDVPSDLDHNLEMRLSTSFEGADMELFIYYETVLGDSLKFEQVRLYLSDISLVRTDGELEAVSEVEFFDFDGSDELRTYSIPAGDYSGFVYHIGVPTGLNGTDDPDFLTNQFGPDHPLNINNGMYWSWSDGYRFAIYEGRIDDTPNNTTDLPHPVSIHLGKDTLYSQVEVNMPFSVGNGSVRSLNIDWDLGKSFYNESDTLDLTSSLENQFHGVVVGDPHQVGIRFLACMRDAITHSVD